MDPLGVALERVPGATVVRVTGAVDVASAPVLAVWLAEAVDPDLTRQRVVVDLAGVSFFGSAAIAVLMRFAGTCASQEVELRVVPTRLIRRILLITGGDQVVVLVTSVEEALAGFAEQ